MPIYQADLDHDRPAPADADALPARCEAPPDDATSDRSELIQRLKRGESPTWIPARHLESLLHHGSPVDPWLLDPDMDRPPSALHSGDFTQHRPARVAVDHDGLWITTSPPRDFTPFHYDRRRTLPPVTTSAAASLRSSSLSSSFAYQPPTSPLVQSETNDDFAGPPGTLGMSRGHHAMASHHSSPLGSPTSRPLAAPTWPQAQRRDASLPCQAHQPRRSLTSTPSVLLHGCSPQTLVMPRSRRPSLGSDASPIQHASMVGSYEESILRGRMSTTPSKPFDFLAQIGVLGKGKCRSSLRCPAHVTLPFPAVYYSYGGAAHGASRADGPSPYVGQIDIENRLPNPDEESRARRKAQSRCLDRRLTDAGPDRTLGPEQDSERRRAARSKRRAASPKAPPGGSYRIPEVGQVQIVIKNQNKTAVKLFLVPYDLSGMEPGTKTFIRQRSYSAGPVVDHVPNASQHDRMSRPMLRYLVHLHVCSPAKGRFYLYKSIRVVFANRVPEGKEKLRNETTSPEPRFTPYKPMRVMHPPASSSGGPGAALAADKALRRRSLGVSFDASAAGLFDAVDGLAARGPPANALAAGDVAPFRLPAAGGGGAAVSSAVAGSSAHARPPLTTDADADADAPGGQGPWGAAQYEKRTKGDLGYPGGAAEGLLTRRLRSLDVEPRAPTDA